MPRSGTVESYGNSNYRFFFKETLYCFTYWCETIYIPTNSIRVYFAHPFQCLLFEDFLNDGHSDWCEVIFHCSFDLRVSDS